MNQRSLLIWLMIGIAVLFMFQTFYQQPSKTEELSYSEFLEKADSGEVSEVRLEGQKITGVYKDKKEFASYSPNDPQLVSRLLENGIVVKAAPPEDSPWYLVFLTSWAPVIILIGVWIFFMRQMQGGGNKTLSFGRSRARMVSQDSSRVNFDNVAGVDEAKEELTEVVDFLSNPKKFTRLGGRIPKGVLLVGPPGTGKTLLARAVAGEAGVPFYSISGSDFVEMFVGVGASRVRDLFAQGKKNAPCLIFIDEIDAVGRQRGAGLGGGHDEREQTLNQLLVEMDGFEANEGVILIAATNRPDVLDPALLRPGRFDRQVVVPLPDIKGRKQILAVHARRTPLGPDVDFDTLAKGTPGFSGADLENLVNEAALLAARQNQDSLTMHEFEEAKDKLLMGKERRTMVRSAEELKRTAYHEAGHAIVGRKMPETDPVHKVTIIPRGRALGVTFFLPEADKYDKSRVAMESEIAMAFGGRAAEILIFNTYTTGAAQDIKQATAIARAMVCQYGMSDAVGPMAVGGQNQEVFVGREWVANKDHSEETSRLVDAEVKRFIDEAMAKATAILKENEDVLHKMAEALVERETLTGAEVDILMAGETLPPLNLNGKNSASRGNNGSGSGPVIRTRGSDGQTGYAAYSEAARRAAQEEDAKPAADIPGNPAPGRESAPVETPSSPGEGGQGARPENSEGAAHKPGVSPLGRAVAGRKHPDSSDKDKE